MLFKTYKVDLSKKVGDKSKGMTELNPAELKMVSGGGCGQQDHDRGCREQQH